MASTPKRHPGHGGTHFLLRPLGVLVIAVVLVAAAGAIYAAAMLTTKPIGPGPVSKEWSAWVVAQETSRSNRYLDLTALLAEMDRVVAAHKRDLEGLLSPRELEVFEEDQYESGLDLRPERPAAAGYAPGDLSYISDLREWRMLDGAVVKAQDDVLVRLVDAGFYEQLDAILRDGVFPTPNVVPAGRVIAGADGVEHRSMYRSITTALAVKLERAIRDDDAEAMLAVLEASANSMSLVTTIGSIVDGFAMASGTEMLANRLANTDPDEITLSAQAFDAVVAALRDPRLLPKSGPGLRYEELRIQQLLDMMHTSSGRFIPSASLQFQSAPGLGGSAVGGVRQDLIAHTYPRLEANEDMVEEAICLAAAYATEMDPSTRVMIAAEFADLSIAGTTAHDGYPPLLDVLSVDLFLSVAITRIQTQAAINRAHVNLAAARYHTIHGEPPAGIGVLIGEAIIDDQFTIDPEAGNRIDVRRVPPASP